MSHLNRRQFFVTLGGTLAASSIGRAYADAKPGPMYAYVGSMSNLDGHALPGEGITVYQVDTVTNRWTAIQRVKDIENANYLTFDRRQRYLYAASGHDRELATAYSIDPSSGKLTLLNRESTGRAGGLYVVVDPTNRYALVAHNPGTIAVLPIKPDGSLGAMTDAADWTGPLGPHRTEQTTPHPHHVVFDRRGRYVIVPDKGLDRVHVFTFDAAKGKLVPNTPPFVAARSGSAPRHAVQHPTKPFVYVVNEIDSTVTTYRFDEDKGTLAPLQVIPSTPTTYTGNNTGVEILVSRSGKFVFVTNRGHNSIATLAVQDSGVLAHVSWEPTRGTTPRFMGFDPTESLLYAANQGSHTIVAFRVDQSSGAVSPTGYVIEVSTPTCIAFMTPGSV